MKAFHFNKKEINMVTPIKDLLNIGAGVQSRDFLVELVQTIVLLHVEEALKIASEKAFATLENAGNNEMVIVVNKPSILTAYSKKDIK